MEIMLYLMEMHDTETNKKDDALRKALSGAIHALFDAAQAADRIDSPDTFVNIRVNYKPKDGALITITIQRGGRPDRFHSYYGEGVGFGISKASVERIKRFIEESDAEFQD